MDFRPILKELDLKSTPKRLAILETLYREPTYLSPEDVRKKLKERFATIGLPTVYRNLEELANGGVVVKVLHPDRKLYYFFCPNKEHHHHFVCTTCRKVEDLNFCGVHEIEREVSKTLNGTISSHIMQVFGTCGRCASGNKGKMGP